MNKIEKQISEQISNVSPKFEFFSDSKEKVRGVINGAGWYEINSREDFEELRKIENTPKGSKHAPIQHYNAVQLFGDRLVNAGISIDRQVGLISPNTEKFLLMCDVSSADLPDFSFQLGIINYNTGNRSMSVVSSEKVFVCSNECFRFDNRDDKSCKRKHLSGIDDGSIISTIDHGIEYFKRFRDERMVEIDTYKNFEVGDRELGDLLLQLHRSPVFGRNQMLVSSIFDEFDNPRHEEFKDRTLWNFHNAATEQLKSINVCNRLKTDAELQRIMKFEVGNR